MKRNAPPPKTDRNELVLRVLLGAVFVLAGFSKAAYPPEAFAASLEGYRLFPDGLLMPMALVLPWVELITGAFLLCGYYTRYCLYVLGFLFTGFFASLLSVIARHIDLDSCGCYGAYGPHFTPPQAFIFDLMLAIVLVYLALRKSYPYSLDNWIEKD